jgi:hypothetical protein
MSAADWTKDRVALLKQAVADGKTSGQAAVILGFERGAIVGKARRLGLRFGTAPNSPAQSKGLVRFHAARRRADRGEMRARVIELYRGGASMRAVARLVDRTHERVRQILLEENIPVRGRGGWTISPNPLDRRKTRTPIKRVDDLLRSGLGVTEIVAQTGLSADHVSHRATLMRMESRRAFTPDSSCPKFAHHEEFCALVTAEGGMPTAVITPSGTMWIDMAGQPWRHQACGNTALKPGRSRMGERHLSELEWLGWEVAAIRMLEERPQLGRVLRVLVQIAPRVATFDVLRREMIPHGRCRAETPANKHVQVIVCWLREALCDLGLPVPRTARVEGYAFSREQADVVLEVVIATLHPRALDEVAA